MPDESIAASPGARWLGAVVPVLTAIVAILSAYTSYTVSRFEGALKAREAELAERRQLSEDRERQIQEYFRIYDLVVASLQANDEQRQEAARAMVAAVIQEKELQIRLLKAMTAAAQPAVRNQAKLDVFNIQESQGPAAPAPARAAGWQGLNWDIFWCESSGSDAQRTAEQLRLFMSAKGATGRVRVRMLPASINTRPGYQASGFEIRPEQGEAAAAKELLDVLAAGPRKDLKWQERISGTQTLGYVSLFVCPTGGAPEPPTP